MFNIILGEKATDQSGDRYRQNVQHQQQQQQQQQRQTQTTCHEVSLDEDTRPASTVAATVMWPTPDTPLCGPSPVDATVM